MRKNLLLTIATALILSGCASIRPAAVQSPSRVNSSEQPRFLDDISATPQKTAVQNRTPVKQSGKTSVPDSDPYGIAAYTTPAVELATETQIKYSLLLDTEVESVRNLKMYEEIDKWYGTRYCLGGTTKRCIDCSAFTQSMIAALYGITMPRTAREQYKWSRRVSRTELKEGDLVFFNTTGGVSHVGIYLQNNKFVHAGSSEGVTISDLYDSYWVKRFIGVGRIK